MSDDEGTLRFLRELDERTEWELDGEMPDSDGEDSGLAGVPAGSDIRPEGDLDSGEQPLDILSCATDMVKEGNVADILVIINDKNDEQFLFTSVERNDLIIGMLEVAKMNWYQTQTYLQNTEEV